MAQKQNAQNNQNVPEGSVLREDGCICPAEVKEVKCECKLETCPYDPRFPNTNQTRRCFLSFVDYQRCVRLLGDYPGCLYFLRCYRTLCPHAWVDKWFEQLEKGTFPKKIYPPKPIIYPPKDVCFNNMDDDQPGIPPSAC